MGTQNLTARCLKCCVGRLIFRLNFEHLTIIFWGPMLLSNVVGIWSGLWCFGKFNIVLRWVKPTFVGYIIPLKIPSFTVDLSTVWLSYISTFDIWKFHSLTFMGRNLENVKKLTLVWIVWILWCSRYLWWIVSGWTMLHVDSAKNITPPKFPSVSPTLWTITK
jgi:hypothetical protein